MRQNTIMILISIAFGLAMSLIFTKITLGRSSPVPVWSKFGLAFDMIPQSFMIGFMSALMPSLAVRKQKMSLPTAATLQYPTGLGVVIRSIALALGTTLLGGGGAIALLALSGKVAIPFATVLLGKALFGAIAAAIVTPLALGAMVGRDLQRA